MGKIKTLNPKDIQPGMFSLIREKTLMEELRTEFKLEETTRKMNLTLKHIDKMIRKLEKEESRLEDRFRKEVVEVTKEMHRASLVARYNDSAARLVEVQMEKATKANEGITQELIQIRIRLKKLRRWKTEILQKEEQMELAAT